MFLHNDSTTSLLLSNLRILDIVSPDTTVLTPHFISSESLLHSLFHALSPEDTAKAFRDCWPIYDPLIAKEFRVVAYKWLSDLKAKGLLGPTIVRKSLLDDRQGERYELLLLSLSSYILRSNLPRNYPSSHALALHPSPSLTLLHIHCLMHTSQLSRDVRHRHKIHTETQSFSRLLHEKDAVLTAKEKAQKTKIDYESIVEDCRMEEARWERNWTGIRGDYVLDGLKQTLTPVPPVDFFSQSYEEAFKQHGIPSTTIQPRSCIQSSSMSITTNIANLKEMEKDLHAQIHRLETVLGPINPVTNAASPGGSGSGAGASPRKSFRKSLPPTPITTPGSSPRGRGLEFTRSYSRLERRASESPLSARGLASEHGNTLESLKKALSELEGSPGPGDKDKGERKKVEKSSIPRRHMSVNSR